MTDKTITKGKGTIDKQWSTQSQKTEDWATQILQKTSHELRWSGRVSRPYSPLVGPGLLLLIQTRW